MIAKCGVPFKIKSIIIINKTFMLYPSQQVHRPIKERTPAQIARQLIFAAIVLAVVLWGIATLIMRAYMQSL
jgi:hypothetical protein